MRGLKLIHVISLGLLLSGSVLAQQGAPDFAKLEKSMMPVSEGLYASKYEVNNAEYNFFLRSMRLTNKLSTYHKCRYDSMLWVTAISSGFNEMMKNTYHSHSAFTGYPVVNISHEGAKAYCEWLSEHYNTNPERKYKKVVFRLPTEAEWLAAADGDASTGLPWGNAPMCDEKKKCKANIKLRNSKDPSKADYGGDGGFQSVHVESYTPNANGLFNIIGNVSEMTAEAGKAKGGNWDSYLEECLVNETQTLQKDPRLGFRVFMEVLD